MIKTNLEQLVEKGVMGSITQPAAAHYPAPAVAYDGGRFNPVGTGGLTFNVKVGDSAFGWAGGDHVEPGVSIAHGDRRGHAGLMLLACIGNDATIVNAALDAKEVKLKGTVGTVTGKHGGEHVIVHFPKRVVERLCVGDQIQVRAAGVGLSLTDHPDIHLFNCGPKLFKALNPTEKGSKLRVQVCKVVPGKLIGAGMGGSNGQAGDYDLQSTSPDAVKEFDLEAIRLGDVLAITDHDASNGPRFQPNAITIAVVVHGASRRAGHGPGLCPIFTTAHRDRIEPIITRKANLADLLALA